MTTLNYTVKFQKTVLASFIGLCLSQSCFALEALSDASLSDTTGEGIALLPQDAYMVFRGYGANETKATLFSDRTNDTGYIHYIPVGPLSAASQDTNKDGVVNSSDHSVGKADIYLYGLALSKSDGNSNSRLASTEADAQIKSWGTAENPWLLKVGTQTNVPSFDPAQAACTATDTACQISYFALEAPLYNTTLPTDSSKGADAYNLKLATWADALVLDQSKAEGDANLYTLGQNAGGASDSTRANKLRLQAIWNGFSLNGSRIQLFQTLGGATNTGGMSAFYNNTLGASGVIRLNSGDAQNVRAVSANNTSRSTSAWSTIHDGSLAGFNTVTGTSAGANCNNTTAGSAPNYSGTGCQYQVQKRTITDTATQVSSVNTNKIFRLSTRETADNPNLLYTPAINGGGAPSFDANEGVYIYNLNTNLVLGSSYQPLILGSDGKNFSLEVARIPNKPEVYKKIYTDYSGSDSSYLGSTCNVYKCGNNGIAGYQGNNATHSSITIGSTNYDPVNNILTAYSGVDAVGVSFGTLNGTQTQTTNYVDLQYQQRQQSDRTWIYGCGIFGSNCKTGTISDWVYVNNISGTTATNDRKPTPSSCNGNSSCGGTAPSANDLPTQTNRTWATSPAVWINGISNPTVQNFVGITPTATPATPNNITGAALNNLGSAAIDGLLIQHMKITTKGL